MSTTVLAFALAFSCLTSTLPLASAMNIHAGPSYHADLTDLCCTTEISGRSSDHAILAQSADRTLARLYKTSVYNQLLTETYCMSLQERDLHVTVHPRCVGHCRQVKEAENAIVVNEHGELNIKQVLVNSGCVFVPL